MNNLDKCLKLADELAVPNKNHKLYSDFILSFNSLSSEDKQKVESYLKNKNYSGFSQFSKLFEFPLLKFPF